jgi:hypothetical protein
MAGVMPQDVLAETELIFLKSNLSDFQRKENSCYGFIEGDESKMEELLDNYMSLTSTCFVRSQCHDKNKGHKRFSNSGNNLIQIII